MKVEFDNKTESDVALDNLLDQVNRQRKTTAELQSEMRIIRSREARTHKTAEAFKSENERLRQEIAKLEQTIRELEIQLTLPENERVFTVNRTIDPFPKQPAYKKIKWAYIIAPIVIVASIMAFKGQWFSKQNVSTNAVPAAQIASSIAQNPAAQTVSLTAPTTPAPIEEGYLTIENPIEKDGSVRVRNGYGARAREIAMVEPAMKFRIREQSPQKIRRTILVNGKSTNVEDFFYRISDKDQWVFGFFTNRRTYQLN